MAPEDPDTEQQRFAERRHHAGRNVILRDVQRYADADQHVLIGIGIPLYIAKDYVSSSVVAALGEALLLGVGIFWRHAGWRRIAVLALAVVCFQALLGMWTVTWLLKPIVVSGHLLGGMATFALLAWVAWRLQQERNEERGQVHFSAKPSRRPGSAVKCEPDTLLFRAAAIGVALLA